MAEHITTNLLGTRISGKRFGAQVSLYIQYSSKLFEDTLFDLSAENQQALINWLQNKHEHIYSPHAFKYWEKSQTFGAKCEHCDAVFVIPKNDQGLGWLAVDGHWEG